MSEAWYRWEAKNLVLYLKVQPRSNRDEYTGPHGDRYKIKISAPPVDGNANSHLIRMLAKDFGVSKSAVHLLAGESSRDKVVRIDSPTRLPVDIK